MRVDLHIHTTASDGCWPPERLIVELQARTIGLFAIADHDSVASLPQAETLAWEAGLAFLRGVEVSTHLDGHLFHVLAYGFDLDDPVLAVLLRETAARLSRANEETIRRLINTGFQIDLADYIAYNHDRTRGGWKALNFLIDRGFCTGVRDYFENLVAHEAIEPPSFPHPADVVAVIREAGGVPVLAHPGVSLRPAGISDETLCPFLEFGIAGLECYSPSHNEATTRFCLDWCARHDLLATGGSDCHGGFVGRELGVPAVETADLRLGELEGRIVR
jgi:predicted metal-dependent phosphoesterase TrpH